MKIIIVSNPAAIVNEANVVNALFNEGLELFHLRKPNYSEKELTDLLKDIEVQNYSKIVLHNFYDLAERFSINRIHFSESERLKIIEEDLKKWKTKNFILSTSIHKMSDYELLSANFSYTFFGPVFESISKPGYKPEANEVIQLPKNENREIRIIAIGGITQDKIARTVQANFDGVALLGSIWNDPKNALKVFKKCCQNVAI